MIELDLSKFTPTLPDGAFTCATKAYKTIGLSMRLASSDSCHCPSANSNDCCGLGWARTTYFLIMSEVL